jgi:TolB-like protein
MKKICVALLCCMTAVSAFAQNLTLDEAIQSIASEMDRRLPQRSLVAVLSFTSSSERLSRYMIDELNDAIVNGGRLTVVDRLQLDLILQELHFQDEKTGLVSDESAQEIGRMLGAQYIVTGSIEVIAGSYRLRTRGLSVENATIAYSSSKNVTNDRIIASLAGGGGGITNDYTASERNRTRGLNIFFGAGSFSQRDYLGGAITAALETGGLALAIVGIVNLVTSLGEIQDGPVTGSNYPYYSTGSGYSSSSSYTFNGETYSTYGAAVAAQDELMTTGIVLSAAGLVLNAGGTIYGLIRPSFTHRPGYVAQGPTNPANWNLALVSDNRGYPAFRLAYKMSF